MHAHTMATSPHAPASRGPRSRQGTGSWPRAGSLHTRTSAAGRSTVRARRLRHCVMQHGVTCRARTADLEGGLELEQDGLAEEDLARLIAERPDFGFGHRHILHGLGAFAWCKIVISNRIK